MKTTRSNGHEKSHDPVRVCLYVRVSTDKQANKEDGSLDTQLDRLTTYVNYKKTSGESWVITEKIVEGERDGKRYGKSGKNTDRDGLRRILELARARLIDVLVVTKIDRISRSVIDFLTLVKELDQLEVKVVSLREQIDLTTPSGKFQTTLLVALAEHERETISVRTKEKVEWRATKGFPLGPPPIGYRMQDKMYVIDEKYAEHVRACDRLYLEHHSTHDVLREFYRLGWRTPHGSKYNVPMICRMLRNPSYAGKVAYGGELYDAQWPPIRDWHVHEQIQSLLDQNKKRNGSGGRDSKEYPYLLQGLLRCSVCERKMTPRPGMGRSGRLYPYYACTLGEKTLGDGCPRSCVPAEALDRAVIEFLKKLELEPGLVREFVDRANAMVSDTSGSLRDDLARVKEHLALVRGKLSNMTDVIAERGRAAMASLGKKLEELEAEREELERSESRLRKELEAEECQILDAHEQVRTLSLFRELVDLNEDHPERIKAMLPRFMDYVVWREENGAGTLEVALFPRLFLAPEDSTLKMMLKDLIVRHEGEACGSAMPLVRGRVSIGVTDGT
jgi:DNA invertase Pin-like site-specific DNA recombinase